MTYDLRTKPSPIDLLAQVPLFRGCSKEQLKALDRATTRAEFPAGHVLCRQGSVGRELMILIDGQAAVECGSHQISILGPTDFIGEVSILDGRPRSATVTALTPVSVLIMMRHEFWQVVDDVPALSHKLLTTLATRLRTADDLVYQP
jgi:CRP-like cAMP-binding protein